MSSSPPNDKSPSPNAPRRSAASGQTPLAGMAASDRLYWAATKKMAAARKSQDERATEADEVTAVLRADSRSSFLFSQGHEYHPRTVPKQTGSTRGAWVGLRSQPTVDDAVEVRQRLNMSRSATTLRPQKSSTLAPRIPRKAVKSATMAPTRPPRILIAPQSAYGGGRSGNTANPSGHRKTLPPLAASKTLSNIPKQSTPPLPAASATHGTPTVRVPASIGDLASIKEDSPPAAVTPAVNRGNTLQIPGSPTPAPPPATTSPRLSPQLHVQISPTTRFQDTPPPSALSELMAERRGSFHGTPRLPPATPPSVVLSASKSNPTLPGVPGGASRDLAMARAATFSEASGATDARSKQGIKVCVRVRPMLDIEEEKGGSCIVEVDGCSVLADHKTFTYDMVFNSMCDPEDPAYASQDVVYRAIGLPILESACQGYNGCLFAYGQTGSGKTHSVLGSAADKGIIYRMAQELFVCDALPHGASLFVWASFLEIYNDHVRDLLIPRTSPQTQQATAGHRISYGSGSDGAALTVLEHPATGVYVKNLTESVCGSSDDILRLLDFAMKQRTVGATQMNAQSSRSHAVFTIRLEIKQPVRADSIGGPAKNAKMEKATTVMSAKINLIDLAGSERASKAGTYGSRMKEGGMINQALTTLGIVIQKLADQQQDPPPTDTHSQAAAKDLNEHVPFRSSKLTFLLKDSLCGNSKTFMMANISPDSSNLQESVSTLRFASSVKKIKTLVRQNIDRRDQVIRTLESEIASLRLQLELTHSSSSLGLGAGVAEEIMERERLMFK